MSAEETRHALLFEPSSSPDSQSSEDFPAIWKATSKDAHLFSASPPAVARSDPQSPPAADPMMKTGGATVPRDLPRTTRHQRHVTLFASVELPPPFRYICGQPLCSPHFPASEQSRLPTRLHLPQRISPTPPTAKAGHNVSHHSQRTSLCANAERGALEECNSGIPEDEVDNLKRSEDFFVRSGMGDVDTRRFVAQELQEINRLIQARALRLRRQEEEAAASMATARNSLRFHAQQLLDRAAEKLERVATQQRRRAEAAIEEASAVLRRALEAQRVLKHERNVFRQLQEHRHDEQQLKLTASNEALQAERLRCRELESRLQALQQENRRLRALLCTRPPLNHCQGIQLPKNEPEAISLCPGQHQSSCQRLAAPARHTSRLCVSRVSSTTVPAVPPVSRSSSQTLMPGRAAAPNRGRLQTGKASVPSSCVAQATARRAIVDVQVRLPPTGPAAGPPASAVDADPHPAEPSSPETRTDVQKTQQKVLQEAMQPDYAALIEEVYRAKSSQSSIDKTRKAHRSVGSSAKQSDDSASSSASRSSSNPGVRRRGWRKVKGRRGSRVFRSASRCSMSTSTSSSSVVSKRRLRGRRGRCSGVKDTESSRHRHISFCVPESIRKEPRSSYRDSSSDSAASERRARGGHGLALRGDVAGRLQESLTRLQERRVLQGQIHSLAERLLNPQRSGS